MLVRHLVIITHTEPDMGCCFIAMKYFLSDHGAVLYLPDSGNQVAAMTAQIPIPHAPGAKMTVVTLTPTK